MLKKFLCLFSQKRITTVAGAWVYFFLSSLMPLAFLLVTAFGVFKVDLYDLVTSRLPEEFLLAGQTIVNTAKKVSSGATVLFVITAIFSCTTLLNQMSKDGDFIYGVKYNKKRSFFRRAWAIIALSALFVLFLLSALFTAFGNFVFAKIILLPWQKLLFTLGVFSAIEGFAFLVVLLLNTFICPIKIKVKNLSVGSAISVMLITLFTIGFTLYLRFFPAYNKFYGALSTIIVFMFWSYVSMLSLVVGVIVNKGVVSKIKNQ